MLIQLSTSILKANTILISSYLVTLIKIRTTHNCALESIIKDAQNINSLSVLLLNKIFVYQLTPGRIDFILHTVYSMPHLNTQLLFVHRIEVIDGHTVLSILGKREFKLEKKLK